MDSTSEAKTLYGPRKLSPEEYAKQTEETTRSGRDATVYGSRKSDAAEAVPPLLAETLGNRPQDTVATDSDYEIEANNHFSITGDEDSSGYVTLSELADVLDKRPQLLDAAIEAEFRSETPRKGALALFLDIEGQRKGGPRPEVIERLEDAQ